MQEGRMWGDTQNFITMLFLNNLEKHFYRVLGYVLEISIGMLTNSCYFFIELNLLNIAMILKMNEIGHVYVPVLTLMVAVSPFLTAILASMSRNPGLVSLIL